MHVFSVLKHRYIFDEQNIFLNAHLFQLFYTMLVQIVPTPTHILKNHNHQTLNTRPSFDFSAISIHSPMQPSSLQLPEGTPSAASTKPHNRTSKSGGQRAQPQALTIVQRGASFRMRIADLSHIHAHVVPPLNGGFLAI